MIKVFNNIYQAETFLEKVDKKCCRAASPYLVKCFTCQGIVCFNHVRTIKKGNKNELVCFVCVYKS